MVATDLLDWQGRVSESQPLHPLCSCVMKGLATTEKLIPVEVGGCPALVSKGLLAQN